MVASPPTWRYNGPVAAAAAAAPFSSSQILAEIAQERYRISWAWTKIVNLQAASRWLEVNAKQMGARHLGVSSLRRRLYHSVRPPASQPASQPSVYLQPASLTVDGSRVAHLSPLV